MAWHICLFGSLHFAFIMPPLPAVFLSFALTASLYSVTFRPYCHDLISTGHLPSHPTPSQKNVQGSMRLITFILWNRLIIQAQMTRDSLVQQFHTRRDCSLQLAAAAPSPQPEWELAEAAGGPAITMLLFSSCPCRSALQPSWAHAFTSGLNYMATQLV